MRAWQRMLSGRRLNLVDPSPLDIEIEDIAHGLSRVARWNGQTRGDWPFSVAQHSLLVEALMHRRKKDLPTAAALAALVHDAPEYVVGDLITPFKAVIGARYKELEHRLLTAVHLRFGLPGVLPDDIAARIKKADQQAAFLEAVQLAGFAEDEARRIFRFRGRAPDMVLAPWSPVQAKDRFLARFAEVQAAHEAGARTVAPNDPDRASGHLR